MDSNIFDKFISQQTLFANKENLRHNHRPTQLPHRTDEIEKISYNLWEALKGHIPSNMTLYGVTGAGKRRSPITCATTSEQKARRWGGKWNPSW